MAAECQQRFHAAFLRYHTQLVQARDLARGERCAGKSRQDLAPPEREGAPEHLLRAHAVAARERASTDGHETIECVRVHLPGCCPQEVAPGDGDQRLTLLLPARQGATKA